MGQTLGNGSDSCVSQTVQGGPPDDYAVQEVGQPSILSDVGEVRKSPLEDTRENCFNAPVLECWQLDTRNQPLVCLTLECTSRRKSLYDS